MLRSENSRYRFWHQQEHLDEIEMSNASETQCINSASTILNSHDDVLIETFQNFNAFELGAVADTCSTFKRNAQTEFSLCSKNLKITNDHDHDMTNSFSDNWLQLSRISDRQWSVLVSSHLVITTRLDDLEKILTPKSLIVLCGSVLAIIRNSVSGRISFSCSHVHDLNPDEELFFGPALCRQLKKLIILEL